MVKNNDDYTREFAELIISQLEKGTAPWQIPWKSDNSFMPYNPKSNINYSGANALILMAQKELNGYSDNRWLTYKQAGEMGGHVKKGEHGIPLQYWRFTEDVVKKDENGQPIKDKEGNEVKEQVKLIKPILNVFVVFNADQINGLPPPEERKSVPQWEAIKRIDDTVKNTGAIIEHKEGNKAYYSPVKDKIMLPFKEQFQKQDDYYSTLLHELGHWTGHEDRLNRDLKNPFGSEEYAKEELRAEIASMMLEDKFAIGSNGQDEQHASYVKSWIKILKDDPKEIFRAAADAQKMTNFAMQFASQKQDLQHDLQQDIENAGVMTEKTYLNVPFKDKEEVKLLGAKWDKQEKSWFVQEKDLKPFEKWLNNKEELQNTNKKEVIYQENVQDQFKSRLLEAGLIVNNVEMDGKTHRVPVQSDKHGAKSGSYRGYLDGRPAGSFINYKTGEKGIWKADVKQSLTPEERKQLIKQAKINKEKKEKEIIEKQEQVANIAKEIIKSTVPASNSHAYLLHKQVNGDFIFQANDETIKKADKLFKDGHNIRNGDLIVPMFNSQNDIRSFQIIQENGFKSFPSGGQFTGLYTSIGEKKDDRPIWIAEGLATAKSLHQATGDQVIVAFNASNLLHVAEEIRKLNPNSDIYFGADNDRHLPLKDPPLPNVGLEKAQEAAEKVDGIVILPTFGSEQDGVDWNDIAKKEGVSGLMRELKENINQSIEYKKRNQDSLAETTEKKLDLTQDAIAAFRDFKGERQTNTIKTVETHLEQHTEKSSIKNNIQEKTQKLSRKISR